MSKLSDQLEAEPLELVLLDQLVEVDIEQLKGDTSVGAKDEMVKHMNDVIAIVFILLAQVLQDSDLFLGLAVEPFLIADHF